VSVDFSLI